MTNGVPEAPLQHPESKVSGAVQKSVPERQREVMARQWTVSHLQDEMRYIREVSGHKGSKEPGLRRGCGALGCFPLWISPACHVSPYR